MANSLTDILVVIQNGVNGINKVAKSISNAFPQVTGTSTGATTGTVSFNSSQPVGFITIVSTSGATLKLPYFNP